MNVVLTMVLAVQMIAALGMIGLILIQHGKGADMGAAFGSGSSGSLFGASGSANFMSRTTGCWQRCFSPARWLLAYFGNLRPADSGSVLDRATVTAPGSRACAGLRRGANSGHGAPPPRPRSRRRHPLSVQSQNRKVPHAIRA
jgi:preprotein translocase subunit SecG